MLHANVVKLSCPVPAKVIPSSMTALLANYTAKIILQGTTSHHLATEGKSALNSKPCAQNILCQTSILFYLS